MRRTPRWSLNLQGVVPRIVPTYEEVPAFVADLEALGVDQVSFGDMLLLEPGLEHGGSFSFDGLPEFLEPLTALAAVAGATSSMRLSTGVLVAPLRHPILLAKAAATVDVLSGGRLDLVLASGWASALFQALGINQEERFARLDEAVRVCRAIWESDPASFDGRWTRFGPMHGGPRPVQNPLPVWLGAQVTPRAAQRAAAGFDGWALNSTTAPDAVATAIDLLDAACTHLGRDPSTVSVRATAMVPARDGVDSLRVVLEELSSSLDALSRLRVDYVTLLLGSAAADRCEVDDIVSVLTARGSE